MIVSELKLYNFRCFSEGKNGEPGLSVKFHQGLNALIGENDSGKTAIIDALKLVLHTKSDYIRPVADDFHVDENKVACNTFRIECTISDFNDNEAKNFIEYLNIKRVDGKNLYFLYLYYTATRENDRIYQDLRAGSRDEGVKLSPRAAALLETVYLKPLRDAQAEMSSGRNSRLSQILLRHRAFRGKEGEQHPLSKIVGDANSQIEGYFNGEDGKEIIESIRENLREFHDIQSPRGNDTTIKVDDINLKSILESLSIDLHEIYPGLGELNLLFIAVELILLKNDDAGALKLALIEELEAHLHPQAQLRLISYLQKEYDEHGEQIIISTHSPVLVSKINLKNIVLVKDRKGYSLAPEETKLRKGDYLFLQRFLDSTKSNMFFAKAIIMVEGDAENLLVPVLAEIIGCPLEKHGVSVVNVGSTAFLRYSNIFRRTDGSTIQIPVAVVTDCDVKPYNVSEDGKEQFVDKNVEYRKAIERKEKEFSCGSIRTFVSPVWTLEYCLASSCLQSDFHLAVNLAKKIRNSDEYALTPEKIKDTYVKVEEEASEMAELSETEKACRIFELMLNADGSSSLKTITAQCLAAILRYRCMKSKDSIHFEDVFDSELYQMEICEEEKEKLKDSILNDPYLSYLCSAIRYASGIEDDSQGVFL